MELEASLQTCVSLESLSYRWLVNPTSVDESEEGYFIEMDPRLPPSKRFNPRFWNHLSPHHDFKFDFPDMHSPPQTLVPADELFAEGFVLPLFTDSTNMKVYESSLDSVSSDPPRSPESSPQTSRRQGRCCSISKRFFCKYLLVGVFRPLCFISHCCRGSSSRVESNETSFAYSGWSRASCDSESSIHEAVLHCKRSNGMRLHVV